MNASSDWDEVGNTQPGPSRRSMCMQRVAFGSIIRRRLLPLLCHFYHHLVLSQTNHLAMTPPFLPALSHTTGPAGKTRNHLCSPLDRPATAGPVVGSTTTSESLALDACCACLLPRNEALQVFHHRSSASTQAKPRAEPVGSSAEDSQFQPPPHHPQSQTRDTQTPARLCSRPASSLPDCAPTARRGRAQ
jgi:hypothetical protein